MDSAAPCRIGVGKPARRRDDLLGALDLSLLWRRRHRTTSTVTETSDSHRVRFRADAVCAAPGAPDESHEAGLSCQIVGRSVAQAFTLGIIRVKADAKVWDSYVENRIPGAWRIWWMYGPDEIRDNQTVAVITVLDIGPHP
jgi:hypothetical protein